MRETRNVPCTIQQYQGTQRFFGLPPWLVGGYIQAMPIRVIIFIRQQSMGYIHGMSFWSGLFVRTPWCRLS